MQESVTPAKLPIDLDIGLLKKSFYELEEALEGQQGLSDLIAMLEEKGAVFQSILSDIDKGLDEDGMRSLVERMFTARRKLWPTLEAYGASALRSAIADLLSGHGDLPQRMQRFQEAIPAQGKAQRALRDLAAELLHFSNPEVYPLMTRWVWDQGTSSGAVREFVRGGDYITDFPLGESPEMFEGVREWMRQGLSELGVYRDLPYLIDVLLAYQYSQYLRAMAEGFLRSDFGGQSDFIEQIHKLLGVETQRRMGGSRIKGKDVH
ncbi:hypothetical protein [Acidithiobacillus sp. AMEEHan]|uniref:hypothetical protein n=1 Tax=Acidithiobacillus sp. AMEEHan TaxID=2994951 RepID=UPI0027E513AE|nr:hypothetical protein [Acidithiobacillus sp. AMEEHan]